MKMMKMRQRSSSASWRRSRENGLRRKNDRSVNSQHPQLLLVKRK